MSFQFKRIFLNLLCLTILTITGCSSMTTTNNSTPFSVGPGSTNSHPLGTPQNKYQHHSNIYLDVVVPVFNPGLPMNNNGTLDYAEIQEQGIWPQLRRAEAKRFAIQTKKHLEKTTAFGSVSVTPSPDATGDLYIIGEILESDSENVALSAMVMDSSGKPWGTKTFKHRVSPGFFRDINNQGKDPYGPVFEQLSDYVYELLQRRTEAQKQTIKDVSMVRYAQHYSPESYSSYIKTKVKRDGLMSKHFEYSLMQLPSDNDRMLNRINVLRQQEQMFLDRLQDQYLAFDMNTEQHYRSWQKETLPEAVAARETRNKRNTQAAISTALAIGAVLIGKNSNSSGASAGTAAAIIGAAAVAGKAFETNEELKVHKASLDEMGENLDISLSPSVMKFDDKTVKLTGTASEQYQQWKNHLRNIYELESASGRTF